MTLSWILMQSLFTQVIYGTKDSVYPKIESGFAYKPHMNDVYVEAFNIQMFNQDGDEYATLRKKYYNPPDLIFQYLPVKES